MNNSNEQIPATEHSTTFLAQLLVEHSIMVSPDEQRTLHDLADYYGLLPSEVSVPDTAIDQETAVY